MTARHVLVTGATGFLGSHVVEAHLEAGCRVRCSVRSTSDLRWLEGLDVERVELDVRDASGISDAMVGIDTVVHAAGITRATTEADYFRVNATGARRLAEAAVTAGVSRFVLISSLAARGPDGMAGPVSPYGESKRRGEDLARLFEEKVELVVLRPGGVYGPRDTELLPLFQTAGRGWLMVPAGGPPLQPVYATDVARLVVAASTLPYAGLGPFPVAEERAYGWDEVAAGLSSALGRRVRSIPVPAGAFILAGSALERGARFVGRRPPLDRRRALDLSRHGWTCDTRSTREAFGWRAQVPLEAGLARTAEWYRRVGWL